jgi:hypothetical protein
MAEGNPMEWQADEIVEIPPNRVRYFGGTGKMLLPCPATVAALIGKIPERKLMTTDLLRDVLTEEFDVQGVCPVTTRKALKVVAHDSQNRVAYWRVITQIGGLFASFPGGVEGHAALLRGEGFTIDTSGGVPKVTNFRDSLVRFG